MNGSLVEKDRNFIWNMVGTISSASISIILLLIVSRMTNPNVADSFSIAFTLGQQFLVIGLFGMRNFQSTDVNETYPFNLYFYSRISSILLMIGSAIAYLLITGGTGEKYWIILTMVLYRMCDALSDIFQGYFQQQQRSDLAGKILFYRSISTILLFIVVLYITSNLLLATLSLFILNLILCYLLDIRYYRKNFKTGNLVSSHSSWKRSWQILKLCLPLFLGNFLINYIFSNPKIIIDTFIFSGNLREGMQRDFNIIFMPTFVLNLSFMLLRPMLTELSITWYKGDLSNYAKHVRKIIVLLVGLHICVLVGGYAVGLPILSQVFGIELHEYRLSFMILLLGAGFNVYAVLIDSLMTIYRKQSYLLIVTVLAFLVSKLITVPLIGHYAILGASISFTITMLVYFLSSMIVYSYTKKLLIE